MSDEFKVLHRDFSQGSHAIQNFRKGELCCPFMTPCEMTEQYDFENHQAGTS